MNTLLLLQLPLATSHHFLDEHEIFVALCNLVRHVVHKAQMQVPCASIRVFDISLSDHKVLRITICGQRVALVLVDILDSLVQLLTHKVH